MLYNQSHTYCQISCAEEYLCREAISWKCSRSGLGKRFDSQAAGNIWLQKLTVAGSEEDGLFVLM